MRWQDAVDQHCGVPATDLDHPDIAAARDAAWRRQYEAEQQRRASQRSTVYFVEAVGTGLVKIGVSKTPARRIADLSRMSGAPLIVIATVAGDQKTENRIHRCFAAERRHGEWFALSVRLRRFIKSSATLGRLPEKWPRTP